MSYNNEDPEIYSILGMEMPSHSEEEKQESAVRFLREICPSQYEEVENLLSSMGKQRKGAASRIIRQAENILNKHGSHNSYHAITQIIYNIIDNGSWASGFSMQDMWAGLLASACTESGNDESNMVFVNLLSQISRLQAKVLDYGSKVCEKFILKGGGVAARQKVVSYNKVKEITGIKDYHRLDRELDHMRYLGLISGGFEPSGNSADITPTQLGLHMFVRCQGFNMPPAAYFRLIMRRNRKAFKA